jgi:hypothetical protein
MARPPLPLLPLVLVLVLQLVVAPLPAALALDGDDQYREVARVERADGGSASASVVEFQPRPGAGADPSGGLGLRLLRYGGCILGARFLAPGFEEYSPFTAFSLMGDAVARVAARQRRAGGDLGAERAFLQLGLGVGVVPQRAAALFDVVDAVENSTVVAQLAREHFGYRAGRVYLADAFSLVLSRADAGTGTGTGTGTGAGAGAGADASTCAAESCASAPPGSRRYLVVAQDLFLGFNPTHVLRREMLGAIQRHWLHPELGVLLVNFVGYHRGPQSLFARSVAATLRADFVAVQCFRDCSLQHQAAVATNIFCLAAQRRELVEMLSPRGAAPDPAKRDIAMDSVNLDWIRDNFEHWRVLEPGAKGEGGGAEEALAAAAAAPIQGELDLAPFATSFAQVAKDMAALTRPMLPERLWL